VTLSNFYHTSKRVQKPKVQKLNFSVAARYPSSSRSGEDWLNNVGLIASKIT